ncbi:sodium/proline symporter PutP [Aestuariibacter sp. AA17]|uniref:Sodium/proline symporter n=1 Tax=Fluctibacter corallii TaxID=2984329 RepID=A0ABT3A9Q2_9ALTE|nr:sodium/proline symporter PutP [Aestuariibacter sp. AA17]MCV2885398.1 sodium/proline symporter PutP [Aestuariibacter sp. AA17]
METGTLISLSIYFIAMLAIGFYAFKRSTSDLGEYMLGGRKLSPGVTALSAGASDMSGWMLMGVPGAMYVSGASSAWIAIGLIVGAFCNYLYVAPRLRVYTEQANNAITIPDYFENRFHDHTHSLRMVASLVIIVFFTLYTSSGVVAGGKLFESSFGLPYETGLYITIGVVVAYTFVGGFLAVSLTDFVQGCIMFTALILVPIVVMMELGGLTSAIELSNNINPNTFNLFIDASNNIPLSTLGIISLLAWGLGYFGQPHIIVRFMAIRNVSEMKTARRIGMSWMIISLIGAMATGLFGAVYVNNTQAELADPETIFVFLSQILFHPFIAGFLLAAILAAIMSTISSQLLVTSSSLTADIYQTFLNKQATQKQLVLFGRLSVVAVAAVAVYLAHDRESTILSLVSNAWAGFGAAFGPIILVSLYWRNMTLAAALSGMIIGALTVLVWIYAPFEIAGKSLSSYMYEIVPGFIMNLCTIFVVSKLTPIPKKDIVRTHDAVEEKMQAL